MVRGNVNRPRWRCPFGQVDRRTQATYPWSVAYAIVGYVNAVPAWMRSLPMPARWVVIGASIAGVAGGIVGLIVGLFVHAPTAPFAAVEVGFPAMLTGGIVGLVAGLIMTTIRRVRRDTARQGATPR